MKIKFSESNSCTMSKYYEKPTQIIAPYSQTEYLAAWLDNDSRLKCNKLKIPCGPNTWAAHAVKKIGVGHGPHIPHGSGTYG